MVIEQILLNEAHLFAVVSLGSLVGVDVGDDSSESVFSCVVNLAVNLVERVDSGRQRV